MTDTTAAYTECRRITATEAKNFSYGIRLLPPGKRDALSAVYALSRRIDDIGDDESSTVDDRLAGLTAVRDQVKRVATGEPGDDPVLVALADAAHRYPIPIEAFGELIDGCEADVQGTKYRTFPELVGYCRQVAGSVGRLSLGVFQPPEGSVGAPLPIADMITLVNEPTGLADRTSAELADALGVALQLTNILRDILEDRRNGRVYLPRNELAQYGCTFRPVDPTSTVDGAGLDDDRAALAGLVRFQARRAERWYRVGLTLLPRLDRRSAACTGAMAGIYHRLLHRIDHDPLAVTRGRQSLPTIEKLAVAVRAVTGIDGLARKLARRR